jgi:hypothetical protein
LRHNRIEPAAFAAECQRVFAASTTLAELPGKNSGGHEVIIQVWFEFVLICEGQIQTGIERGISLTSLGGGLLFGARASGRRPLQVTLKHSFLRIPGALTFTRLSLHIRTHALFLTHTRAPTPQHTQHALPRQGNWVAKLQLPDHLMCAHGIPKHYLFVKQLK